MPRRTTKIPDRVIVAPLGWSASRAFDVGLYSRVLVRCLDAFALTESQRWHDEGLDTASRLRTADGFHLVEVGGIATSAEAALQCRLGRWEQEAGDELAEATDDAHRRCKAGLEIRFGEAVRHAVLDHPVGLYERQLDSALENDVPVEFRPICGIGEHVADLWVARSEIDLGRVVEADYVGSWELSDATLWIDALNRLCSGAGIGAVRFAAAELLTTEQRSTLRIELVAILANALDDPPPSDLRESVGELSNEEKALGVLAAHPDWGVTQIAAAVGMHRGTLYKKARFMAAYEINKQQKQSFPRGWKDFVTGDVEAYE